MGKLKTSRQQQWLCALTAGDTFGVTWAGLRHDEGRTRHHLSQVAEESVGEGGAIWHCRAEPEDMRVVPQGDGILLMTVRNQHRLQVQQTAMPLSRGG
jgi:hypothetical protein